jgi:transcriptional regulator with GAF, ATPase, and Fis domain
MGLARLVVIEGPDVGCEFAIPLRGGGIGRGEDNLVQLSDLSVSRTHCTIELRENRLALVDHGSRNKTLINGKPVDVHLLVEGDEITVGKSRLAFLPAEGGVAVLRQAVPGRVTMEVGTGELMRFSAQRVAGHDRAARHLSSLATFGDNLGAVTDRAALGRAACEAALQALAADRAFLVIRDASGRMTPTAAAVNPSDTEGAQLALPREVIDKVVSDNKAIAIDRGDGAGDRVAVAAPLTSPSEKAPIGLLYADRRAGNVWDRVDLMAAACLANLTSAALAGFDSRATLARENQDLESRLGDREFIGDSDRARAVLEFVGKVGPSDATVLLTGESGSGKEMVARGVHRASRRTRQPFIAVNCAALTETLIESELFGHEKGAFTGATERKIGRFEAANKGTLFLDEVGELPLSCQTKFLRVLEEQCFERVGGTRSIHVDVRVVAATNRDLPSEVQRGAFREDLYYRLSVIHTVVPPLRERREDIITLARYFLGKLRSQVARRVTGFEPEAEAALIAHPWPGNVRELKNAVERAIVLGEGELIRPQDLPPTMNVAARAVPSSPAGVVMHRQTTPPTAPFAMATPTFPSPGQAQSMPAMPPSQMPTPPAAMPHAQPAAPAQPRSLKELEREGIVAALQATGGNKAQAAAILEIDRSTLYKKIKDYGIET